MKKLLVILSLVYLNTVSNSKTNKQKNTQVQKKAQKLNITKGKRQENLKKEIEMLKNHLQKELEHPKNSLEYQEALQHAIFSLEQDLKKFKN